VVKLTNLKEAILKVMAETANKFESGPDQNQAQESEEKYPNSIEYFERLADIEREKHQKENDELKKLRAEKDIEVGKGDKNNDKKINTLNEKIHNLKRGILGLQHRYADIAESLKEGNKNNAMREIDRKIEKIEKTADGKDIEENEEYKALKEIKAELTFKQKLKNIPAENIENTEEKQLPGESAVQFLHRTAEKNLGIIREKNALVTDEPETKESVDASAPAGNEKLGERDTAKIDAEETHVMPVKENPALKPELTPSVSEVAFAVPEVVAQADTAEKEALRERMIKEAEKAYEAEVGKKNQYIESRKEAAFKQKRQEKINEAFKNLSEREQQKYNNLMRGTEETLLSAKQIEGLFAAGYDFKKIINTKRTGFWRDKFKSELLSGQKLYSDDFDKEIDKLVEANEDKIKADAEKEIGKIWDERYDYYLKQIPQKVDEEIKLKEEEKIKKAAEKEADTKEKLEKMSGLWKSAYALDKALKEIKGTDTKEKMQEDKNRISTEIVSLASMVSGRKLIEEAQEKRKENGWAENEFQKYLTGQVKEIMKARGLQFEGTGLQSALESLHKELDYHKGGFWEKDPDKIIKATKKTKRPGLKKKTKLKPIIKRETENIEEPEEKNSPQ
jgi:hypothetical protein